MKGGDEDMGENDITKTYKVENGEIHLVLTLGNISITCDNNDVDYRETVNELLKLKMR
jgi:hypothetical protein